jgi:uncharacterized protein Veg
MGHRITIHSETTKWEKNTYFKQIIKTYLKHFIVVYSNYSSNKWGFFNPQCIVEHQITKETYQKKM